MFGDHYKWVRIHPNHQFLAKNETAAFRRWPLMINAFKDSAGEHHLLCPVADLNTSSLFINPWTLVPCSKSRISQLIRWVVMFSQPGIYARAHDLRKFATLQAFFDCIYLSDLRSSWFWRSNHTIASSYLPINVGHSKPCVAMGRVTGHEDPENL